MAVLECLAAKAGMILEGKASFGSASYRSLKKIEQFIRDLQSEERFGTDVTKELKAAQNAAAILKDRLDQKAKQVLIHADLVAKAVKRFNDNPDVPVDVVLRSFTFGDEADAFKYGYLGDSAFERIHYWQDIYGAQATDILKNIDPATMGALRSKATQKEIIDEVYYLARGIGKRSDNKVVRETAEKIQQLVMDGGKAFHDRGGNITLRNDFILGLNHNIDKIIKAGPDEWVSFMKDNINLDDLYSAGVPPSSVTDFLRDVYQTITTNGRFKLPEYMPAGLKSVVNKRNHHRILNMKDSDAWWKYHELFSEPDVYSAVSEYSRKIGKDIGLLETYGPKPEAFVRSALREADKINPQRVTHVEKEIRTQFMYVTGQWDNTIDPVVARYMANYRSAASSGMLGSTVVDASIGDTFGLGIIPRLLRGLPVLRTLQKDLALTFKSGIRDDYEMWSRLGWTFEAFADESRALLRASASEGSTKFFNNAARLVMKYTGLTRKTWATKGASMTSLSERLADLANLDADPALKRWLSTKGVSDADIKIMQEHGIQQVPGWHHKIVSVTQLHEKGFDEVASRLHYALNQSAELASPTSSAKWSAKFAALERSGLFGSIVGGSSKTFTGYLASYWENHFRMLWSMPGVIPKAAMAAQVAIMLPLFYAVSGMVRDMLSGRTPALNQRTVVNAFARSNALPIIGDYIFTSGDSFSGSVTDRLSGVALQLPNKAIKATSELLHGNVSQSAQELLNALRSLVPGQSAWFASLILKRCVFDQIKLMIDPRAPEKFRAQIARDKTEGNPQWWEAGKLTPN